MNSVFIDIEFLNQGIVKFARKEAWHKKKFKGCRQLRTFDFHADCEVSQVRFKR